MTQRKKESALGRGLDALIRLDANDTVDNDEANGDKAVKSRGSSGNKRSKTKASNNSRPVKNDYYNKKSEKGTTKRKSKSSVEDILVENVIIEVRKNPRISLWSAKSAAVLRLLKKTKPEFSISKEASALIEDAVKDKYPDLWQVFEDKEI
jgi:hypothetical protein